MSNQDIAPIGNLARGYFSLAQLQERRGKVEEAVAAYQQALKNEPNLAEAHASLGRLFRQQSALEEAIAHYQKALAVRPQWWQGHQELAETFWQRGDLASAASSYKKVIALVPQQATLHYKLGIILEQQGKLTEACQVYRQAITLAPTHASAYSSLGRTLAKLDQIDQAIENLERAIKLRPEVAAYHNNLGLAFIWKKRNQNAILAYRKAIQLKPSYSLAHYNLGKALQDEGLHTEAVICFEKVIAIEPDHLAAFSDWGISLMQIGETEKALQCWQTVVASCPQQLQSYQQWVEANFSPPQDAWEQARVACAEFLKSLQESNFQKAQANLKQVYTSLGDATGQYGIPEQAEKYYQSALRLHPQDSALQVRLADSLVQQKRIDSAIALYRLALTLKPDSASIRFQLARLLETKGNWKSAIQYYQELWSQQEKPLVPASSSPVIPPPKASYPTTESWLRATHQLDQEHYVDLGGTQSGGVETNSTTEKITCNGLNCRLCLNRLSSCFEPTELNKGIYACTFPQEQPVTSPPRFVARIPQGKAWAVPQKNHWLICKAFAVITPNNYVLKDVSRHYPGQLPGCPGTESTHDIFLQKTLPPIENINGTVAVLTGLSGNVYFHWLVDILPRFALLEKSGIDLNTIDGFWINQVTQPFQRETLKILGVSLDKIIASDKHPHIEAKELIVPSFSGYLGWLSPWGLKFLRDKFLTPLLEENTTYPERIYICRRRARHRRVLNEEVVIDYLKTRGFVPISLETLSFQEQINQFAKAKVIIAPHGSGLTNLIFCSPQTKVIELFSPNYIRYYFWVISQQLALQHYFLLGETIFSQFLRELMYQTVLSEDIWLNLERLKKVLDQAQIY